MKSKNLSNVPQSGSLGMSAIRNIPTSQPPANSGTRTHNVSPNTLSPPPGLMQGSGITRLNIQTLKTKNSLEQPKGKGTFAQNFPMKKMNNNYMQQRSYGKAGKFSHTGEKRDFVSMDDALGLLKFINQKEAQAFRNQNIPLEQIRQLNQQQSRRSTQQYQQYPKPSQQLKRQGSSNSGIEKNTNTLKPSASDDMMQLQSDDEASLTQTKKKLNKNRAIKRIIETAFDILQKNYHFSKQTEDINSEERSTSTQFNIYLKQYNRIIEQINSKQQQQINKTNRLYDQNQDELQEVFEYTVMQDFREKLSVLWSKQKISKNNVSVMINAFRQSLVILKLNEMRVQSLGQNQPSKSFKISEIQNIEYFTHPYVFIVLTIIKDKTKSKQHLYLKFTSEENQDKWDRALYCCFMSRKMNKKEKLFEIEFPVEDVMKKEKEEHVKADEVYVIGQQIGVVQRCFKLRNTANNMSTKQLPISPTSNNPSHTQQFQSNMLSDRTEYMNTLKTRNLTQNQMNINVNQSDRDNVRRTNTSNLNNNGVNMSTKSIGGSSGNNKMDSAFKGVEMNDGQKNTAGKGENNMEGSNMSFGPGNNEGIDNSPNRQSPKSNIFSNNSPAEHSQQSNNLSKRSTFNKPPTTQFNPNTKPYSPTSQPPYSRPPSNAFMKLLKIAEEEQEKKSQLNKSIEQNEKLMNEKVAKLKKIREIQKMNVRGIVCQKEKFFVNKEKIIFFYDQTLINSSRKDSPRTNQMTMLQNMRQITSQQLRANKYLQYWDYDYKKDYKQERKLISVASITDHQLIPSQLTESTTTLLINYIFKPESGKMDKKQLRLMFANGISEKGQQNNSKAYEVAEWIRLVKDV